MTIHDAPNYHAAYYADEFRFGQGTEDLLALLAGLPPARSWVDLGAGSESLLWAIPLRAQQLVALDRDPERLALLRAAAQTAAPRGVHRTAMGLTGRSSGDWMARCRSLRETVVADLLVDELPRHPALAPGSADLVTQFGLLGLVPHGQAFVARFAALHHQLLTPAGGIAAGANWVTSNPATASARVRLTAALYHQAATRAGIRLHTLRRVPITGDADFSHVWLYAGRTVG